MLKKQTHSNRKTILKYKAYRRKKHGYYISGKEGKYKIFAILIFILTLVMIVKVFLQLFTSLGNDIGGMTITETHLRTNKIV